MSTCISKHGEFGSHNIGDAPSNASGANSWTRTRRSSSSGSRAATTACIAAARSRVLQWATERYGRAL